MSATLSDVINQHLVDVKPATIVYGTLSGAAALYVLSKLLEPGFLHKRTSSAIFKAVRVIGAPIIAGEVQKAAAGIAFPQKADERIFERLPAQGLSHKDILALCDSLHDSLDVTFAKGGLSGAVYHGGVEHTDMVNKVMEVFQWSNPLHMDVCGAVRKMEAEIVSMVVDMFNGSARPDACGALTSGGTESIGMAVKVYRDWGLDVLKVTTPSIVMPITAHPAFNKAAAYYGVELITVPVGPSGMVDPQELASYIRADTVAIVGSSPTFPHGTIDPIKELSEIAYSRGIGMHVDACLGGFIIPFMADAGFPNPPVVDFRLRGVTTISCDTHKYGFAPKGTSTILYATKKLRSYQFFTTAAWPGGIYCSPGASGSKAGNVIAGTWASMISFGRQGYVESCRQIVSTREKVYNAFCCTPGIEILGTPAASVLSFTSSEVDIYALNDILKKKGWMLNPLQYPVGLQFSMTLLQTHEGVAERFIDDVRGGIAVLRQENVDRKKQGLAPRTSANSATMYGSQQRIPDRNILAQTTHQSPLFVRITKQPHFTMMLNKQFLALAFAAGATFLVGCEDDDANPKDCDDFELATDTAIKAGDKCFDCYTAVTLATTETDEAKIAAHWASVVSGYEACGIEWDTTCKGMDKITTATADKDAGRATILAVTDTTKLSALQKLWCTQCFTYQFDASTADTAPEQADAAWKACGVDVEIPA